MPENNSDIELLREAEYIAPGQMGTFRKSMFRNELLRRAPLGRSLTRGRSLPPSCFIYGKKSERDPNGLNKCLTWSTFRPSSGVGIYEIDYKRMNMDSARAGIHKTSELAKFRKERDYHHKPVQRSKEKIDFPVEMTFGMRRPTSPVDCLLSFYYKREFDRKATEANLANMANLVKVRTKSPRLYDTLKSTHSVAPLSQSKPEPTKLWTMKRFQSQPPRISTHWSEEENKKMKAGREEKAECILKVEN